MARSPTAEDLARLWIDCWNEGRPGDIPLAEYFVHTSPFGRVAGRAAYLEWVKPLAAKNVATLRVEKTLGSGNEAVIQFEMDTPAGAIPVVDWVSVDGDEIVAIHSFYDASSLDTGS